MSLSGGWKAIWQMGGGKDTSTKLQPTCNQTATQLVLDLYNILQLCTNTGLENIIMEGLCKFYFIICDCRTHGCTSTMTWWTHSFSFHVWESLIFWCGFLLFFVDKIKKLRKLNSGAQPQVRDHSHREVWLWKWKIDGVTLISLN